LHRNIRQTVLIEPLNAPYFVKAWTAYSEQEGEKRQTEGNKGEITI